MVQKHYFEFNYILTSLKTLLKFNYIPKGAKNITLNSFIY